jgi:hypothetical protein
LDFFRGGRVDFVEFGRIFDCRREHMRYIITIEWSTSRFMGACREPVIVPGGMGEVTPEVTMIRLGGYTTPFLVVC